MRKFFYVLLVLFISSEIFAHEAIVSYQLQQNLNEASNESSGIGNWVSFDFHTGKAVKKVDTYLDGAVRFFHGTDDYMYSVSEVYFTAADSGREKVLSVGRKVVDWNMYEKFWGMNNINPQRSFDLLDTHQEGLTGIHYDHRFTKNISASVIFSYLYIPQLNPSLDIKDGKITTPAQWYVLPPTKTRIKGQDVPIHYQVDSPSVTDVVFQKTMGLDLSYRWDGGFFSTYGLFKPENELRINAFGFYDQDVEKVVVKAQPVVNYHSVYGFLTGHDFGFMKNNIGVEVIDPNASMISELQWLDPLDVKPSKRTFNSEYFSIEPSYVKETYFHYGADFQLLGMNVNAGYIKLLSKETAVGDDFGSDPAKWKSAFGVGADYNLTDHFRLHVKWQYDFSREDNILKGELGHTYKFLNVAIGAELLGSPRKESFWCKYRTNDLVYTRLGYVF
ncbi:MAG: hypothetical protein KAQ98_12695 [Bacteriovoracaceae bacterium]|nr:hypothetical protein [Bacteriovoracaceae bacterium]